MANQAIAFAATVAFALSLASCATKPASVPEDIFATLGGGASAYFSFPLTGNRELASLFALSVGETSLTDALDRTDIVQGAAFSDGEIRIVARGNYPRSLSGFAFPRSKGWKKTTVKGTGSWYSRDIVDAAIPQSGLACVVRRKAAEPADGLMTDSRLGDAQQGRTSRGIEAVLGGLRNPSIAPFPGDFAALANDGANDGGIFLLVNDAAPWVTLMLGPDVALPVEYALMSAFPEPVERATVSDDGPLYSVSVSVTAKDARTARAMLTILRLAFPQYQVGAFEREIRVEGVTVTAAALVDFARNLYF